MEARRKSYANRSLLCKFQATKQTRSTETTNQDKTADFATMENSVPARSKVLAARSKVLAARSKMLAARSKVLAARSKVLDIGLKNSLRGPKSPPGSNETSLALTVIYTLSPSNLLTHPIFVNPHSALIKPHFQSYGQARSWPVASSSRNHIVAFIRLELTCRTSSLVPAGFMLVRFKF